MSSNQGGESPPPERQTGEQLHDVMGSGTISSKEQISKKQSDKKGVEGLKSNPKGPLDDILKEKYAKPTSK